MIELAEKVKNSENLIIVYPIYYYSVTGNLKTFLDRCNSLFGQVLELKNIYLISPCAVSNEDAIDPSIETLKGFAVCFNGVELKEYYTATASVQKGDVSNNTKPLEYAYNLGKRV